MNTLISIHNSIFRKIEALFGPWLLPTLARFTFAATLLIYFWNSASLKIGAGLFGFLDVSNAYAQIYPRAFDAAGYDSDAMTTFQWLVTLAGLVRIPPAAADRDRPVHPPCGPWHDRLCHPPEPDRHLRPYGH